MLTPYDIFHAMVQRTPLYHCTDMRLVDGKPVFKVAEFTPTRADIGDRDGALYLSETAYGAAPGTTITLRAASQCALTERDAAIMFCERARESALLKVTQYSVALASTIATDSSAQFVGAAEFAFTADRAN